jgi:hypothetical protein
VGPVGTSLRRMGPTAPFSPPDPPTPHPNHIAKDLLGYNSWWAYCLTFPGPTCFPCDLLPSDPCAVRALGLLCWRKQWRLVCTRACACVRVRVCVCVCVLVLVLVCWWGSRCQCID